MAVSELPGNPNAVWTVKTQTQGGFIQCSLICCYALLAFLLHAIP